MPYLWDSLLIFPTVNRGLEINWNQKNVVAVDQTQVQSLRLRIKTKYLDDTTANTTLRRFIA